VRGPTLLAVAFAITTLAAPIAAGAQPTREGAVPPRICLVLSGGGARGAAHIGVIKVLEELRVPIHCITGTSMGSLVGGAYASGMSVAEMERIVGEITTDLLFKEKPPRQDTSIRRKADDKTILFSPELGVRDGGLLLPKGIVSGVQLEAVLRRLANAKGYRRFDELPIPYRAVATDLVTGKAVIFSEGELALVMRASMSVPGAVAAAEFDGKILVDGGLTNNLPIDAARAMGADIVIAVNLGTPLLAREELGSILGATGQMINILTEQNVRASLAMLGPRDILVLPELGDFSAADFDHLPKTIPIGEAAVRKVADRLAPYALPPEQYAALRSRQQVVSPLDMRPVDEIRFENLARVNPEVARENARHPSRESRSTRTRSTATCAASTVPATSSTSTTASSRSRDGASWRWRQSRNRGVPITCGSGWGCPPTSGGTHTSTCSRAIARPGSIRSAPNGAPTFRSVARADSSPSSTSRCS
jgi:NTE family protein